MTRKPRRFKIEPGLRVRVFRFTYSRHAVRGPKPVGVSFDSGAVRARIDVIEVKHLTRETKFSGKLAHDVDVGDHGILPTGTGVWFTDSDVDYDLGAQPSTFTVQRIATLESGAVVLISPEGKSIAIKRIDDKHSQAIRSDHPAHLYDVALDNDGPEAVHVSDIADLGDGSTAF